ncbi:MAG: c-type cytochrome [Acetobacteraceae bacterium]
MFRHPPIEATRYRRSAAVRLTVFAALSALVVSVPHSRAAAPGPAEMVPNSRHGARLIVEAGCGTCHTIPGIPGARGEVGPPLNGIANRTFLAGVLPNTRQDMVLWLMAPQSVVPGNAMPDMNLSKSEARDITAYLFTLH